MPATMEPAQTIIRKLGGPSAVADIVGVHRTRVSNWKRSRESGGTNGRIPQNHIPALLAFAREHGLEITAADFFEAPPSVPDACNGDQAEKAEAS